MTLFAALLLALFAHFISSSSAQTSSTSQTHPCIDELENCDTDRMFCTIDWYKKMCQKTCGVCTAPPICFDKAGEECENYEDLCDLPFLMENCAQTCNNCIPTMVTTTTAPIPPMSTTTIGPCADGYWWCSQGSFLCGTDWFNNLCQKTCGVCKEPEDCENKVDGCNNGLIFCALSWYGELCQKSCKLCQADTACNDILSNCAEGSLFCSRPWYASVCGKSCGRCGHQPVDRWIDCSQLGTAACNMSMVRENCARTCANVHIL